MFVMLWLAQQGFAQHDSLRLAGRYVLIQHEGWTNYTLPNGDRVEVAPLPISNSAVIELDKQHYCSKTHAQHSAGILSIYYGRWRLQQDTLIMTFSKQESSLWMAPEPIRPAYIERLIVDTDFQVLRSCQEDRQPLFRRVAE